MRTRAKNVWRLAACGLVVTAAAAVFLGGASASGGVLFVSPSGSDSSPCTAVSPCKTIGHAVSTADPGAIVLVGPGTYPESVAIGTRVMLLGQHSVIDATGHTNGIAVSGPGSSGTVIQGFTVENANAEGILATATSHLMLKANTIVSNDKQAHNSSGPPQCQDHDPVPGDCGEGIHLNGVTDSMLVGNEITNNIGGILLTDEAGPSARNTITNNNSHDNREDCGITLASHNGGAADPSVAGVYGNSILNNNSQNNGIGGGGAGVGMFAAAPGAASYNNHVIGNTLTGNTEAGAAVHSHAPNQNVSGNEIVGNTISGNGSDPDAGSNQNTGISVWSAVVPSSVTVVGNRISNEYYGIFIGTHMTVNGLITNSYGGGVTKPVGP
jgi:parallel beta-helix repeat protein